MNKNKKYDRRRALNCTLIDKSKNHPGYFKYDVTIGEKDGDVHTEPAYGKDMQDALSRLLKKEKLVRIGNSLDEGKNAGWVFLVWVIMTAVPAYYMEKHGSPIYVLYGFMGVGVLIGLSMWYYNYVNRE